MKKMKTPRGVRRADGKFDIAGAEIVGFTIACALLSPERRASFEVVAKETCAPRLAREIIKLASGSWKRVDRLRKARQPRAKSAA